MNKAHSLPESTNAIAGALLGLAMLFLVHRYWGIDHDATLYLGEALKRRDPDIFSRDLYFAFGSQGKYTIFPLLLASLMAWVDPATLFLVGGLAGLVLFGWASWFSLSSMLPAGQRYWAWLGAICLPTFYGRMVIFGYAEPFLTPRPFAEALALVALGLAARHRASGALACMTLAGLLHPLQAIGAVLVLWPFLVLGDRRWLHALWLLLPLAGTGLAALPPFDGLLRRLDPAWLAELRAITGQLFVTGWSQMDYQYMAFDAALLAYAWQRHREGAFGRFCLAALAGLVLGVGASLLLVDVLQLALPTALQLWRVHWLVHWLAMAAFAMRLYCDLAGGQRLRATLLILAGLLAWGTIAWAWVPFALLYAVWPRLLPNLQPLMRRTLAGVIGLGIVLLLTHHVAMEWIPFRLHRYQLDAFAIDRRILAYPLLSLGLPMVAAYAWLRRRRRTQLLVLAVGLLPLVAVAALRWDIRTPQNRALLDHAGQPELFGAPLPRHSQVYWHEMSLVATWLVLERADYYDPQQLSGIAFNPGTIRKARARLTNIGPLIDTLSACKHGNTEDSYSDCNVSDDLLRRTCSLRDSSGPDYLVLPFRLRFEPKGKWQLRDSSGRYMLADWSLYSCGELVAQLLEAGQP